MSRVLESLYIPDVQVLSLGRSVEGQPLDAVSIQCNPADSIKQLIILAGVHGDELEGVWLVEELRSQWSRKFPFKKVGVYLWGQVNPDGVRKGERWNANHVDLNRNLPTKDWTAEIKNPRYPPGREPSSEPETRALLNLLQMKKPQAVLSLHSYEKPQINVNGPAQAWAEALASVCAYPITEDIGYPTPGSLGTYMGNERHVPTITLEIERGLSQAKVLALHIQTIERAIEYWNQ